jgi:CBS domain-containing protein
MRPSASLLANFRADLRRHPPFDRMEEASLDFFTSHARELYLAPDEVLLEPASGPVQDLFYIRQGAITSSGPAHAPGDAFEYEAGDLFPAGAALAARAVTRTYRATQDTFVLALPVPALRELAASSSPFSEFLNRRLDKYLELSGRAQQEANWSRTLAEQTLETQLGEILQKPAVTCPPDTPLRQALQQMHSQRIGSVLVTEADGTPAGILTRYDVLDRVALPAIALDTPVSAVMTSPVHTLTVEHTAQDAALLMSRHAIRHLPILRDGRVVGVVSERDLFALQRVSLKGVSTALRSAVDVASLKSGAAQIAQFARSMLGQGVSARHATALISHLNDVLTVRLIELEARRFGIDMRRLCWLALGSEGRAEQTIATDQDNALILPDDEPPERREAILEFAKAVNVALDACGYPLCKGGIMAGQPALCRTLAGWREAFAGWIDHGAPEDLLDASIFFDFRPIAGNESLALSLREEITQTARRNPRFLKQMAINALGREVPLDWRGAIAASEEGSVDLKLQGAAIFTDVARIYSLALGIAATGTRQRLQAMGASLGVPAAESGSWTGGFEFIQSLRLRVQLDAPGGDSPNRIRVASLSDLDRRVLKESFRVARLLQQRLRLDYDR